jgi:hypothetical protein
MQISYSVHILGAAAFVVFGIVHSRKLFVFLLPGMVLYGIDVALRYVQTARSVTIHVNPGSHLVSMVIPLEVRRCFPVSFGFCFRLRV